MEWTCILLEPKGKSSLVQVNVSNADSSGGQSNLTTNFVTQGSLLDEQRDWDFRDWSNNVFVPFLCCFGIIGNALNLVILGKKMREGKSLVFSFSII